MVTVIQVLWAQAQVRQGIGVGLTTAAVVGLLRARSGQPFVALAGLVASMSLILSVTLFSWRGPGGVEPGARLLSQCRVGVPWASLLAELQSPDGLLNMALFVPLALFATLLWRRPVVAVLAAAALSACIEITQAFGGAHDCTSTDTISNTAGAVLGAACAWTAGKGGGNRHTTRASS